MKLNFAVLITSMMLGGSVWAASDTQTLFVAKEYAFDVSSNPNAPEIVHSLCASRCNAISGNIYNYLQPGAASLIKLESDKKVIVDIDNPFVSGKCVCTGDYYLVTDKRPSP